MKKSDKKASGKKNYRPGSGYTEEYERIKMPEPKLSESDADYEKRVEEHWKKLGFKSYDDYWKRLSELTPY